MSSSIALHSTTSCNKHQARTPLLLPPLLQPAKQQQIQHTTKHPQVQAAASFSSNSNIITSLPCSRNNLHLKQEQQQLASFLFLGHAHNNANSSSLATQHPAASLLVRSCLLSHLYPSYSCNRLLSRRGKAQ